MARPIIRGEGLPVQRLPSRRDGQRAPCPLRPYCADRNLSLLGVHSKPRMTGRSLSKETEATSGAAFPALNPPFTSSRVTIKAGIVTFSTRNM